MDQPQALQLAVQVMMGVALAACAGLRAWLPLLALGSLGRLGFIALNPSFHFLQSTPALVVFGVATVLEFLGDKVISVDHALDAAGTFIRPVAGALLTAAALSKTDPLMATVAGVVVGGTAALTVHSGKAVVRAKSTALSPFHGGLGNALLSLVEDAMSAIGTALAFLLPIFAFMVAVGLILASLLVLYLFWKAGRSLWRLLFTTPHAAAGAEVP